MSSIPHIDKIKRDIAKMKASRPHSKVFLRDDGKIAMRQDDALPQFTPRQIQIRDEYLDALHKAFEPLEALLSQRFKFEEI